MPRCYHVYPANFPKIIVDAVSALLSSREVHVSFLLLCARFVDPFESMALHRSEFGPLLNIFEYIFFRAIPTGCVTLLISRDTHPPESRFHTARSPGHRRERNALPCCGAPWPRMHRYRPTGWRCGGLQGGSHTYHHHLDLIRLTSEDRPFLNGGRSLCRRSRP